MAVEKNDSRAAALGQQLGGATAQRGLHGVAAGIMVLSTSQLPGAADATTRMVHYLQHRPTIEAALVGDPSAKPTASAAKIDEDKSNTIKSAELVYALTRVPGGRSRTEEAIHGLVTQLTEGLDGKDAWGYSLDLDDDEEAVLPTAFAVQALQHHGVDVQRHVLFLRRALEAAQKNQTDISVQVFVLYVLCFLPQAGEKDTDLRKHFDRLWDQLAPLLDQDLEANIEYVIRSHYEYIRVPWQLYLLACAAKLAPYKRFAGSAAQRRLRSIMSNASQHGGLVYPHSGSGISTRTNAILHDVLSKISTQLEIKRFPLRPFEAVDSIAGALRSRVALYLARILVAAFVVWSVVIWAQPGPPGIEDLGPNFLASVLLVVFATQRRAAP